MFGLFTTLTGVWAWYVWNNRQYAHRIHILMGLLCFFKALTVMSQAGMYHFIERTGHADGWNIAYYIFTFFRGVLFFTVVVLIGTGWSYMVSAAHCGQQCTASSAHRQLSGAAQEAGRSTAQYSGAGLPGAVGQASANPRVCFHTH